MSQPNRSGTTYSAPTDANRNPVALGVADSDGITPKPVEINANGGVDVNIVGGSQSGINANLYTGQVTVSNISAVQLNSSSHSLSSGIIIHSLSSNAKNILVGLSGVTTTTGDVLEPGETRGYALNNTNLLYIISADNATDKVSYEAN